MVRTGVHAATDVTGFGLFGHLHEMLQYSGVAGGVRVDALPLLPGTLAHAEDGVNTGGGRNNAAFLGERVRFAGDVPPPLQVACFDPQTSGGLLIAVAEDRTTALLEELEREAVEVRAIIGRIVEGPPGTIRAGRE